MNRVVNFHSVNDKLWFESVVKILKSKYRIVSIGELEKYFYHGNDLVNSCHITCDDGDKTFYELLYPVLKEYNIPATIFVSPSVCKKGVIFWFQELRGYNEIEMKKII